MHELALSYAPAHRKLYDWLEEAELSLYVTNHVDEEALAQLWAYMTLLRHWLSPLNVAGLRVERHKAWLPNVTVAAEVERIDDRVDRALASLRSLATALRSAFASVYSVEEQRGRDRREATQRRVELIAAAFLVPTLVVGFYGANTWLPGQGSNTGKTEAFIEMAVAIILFTSVVVFLLWQWHRHQEEDVRRRDEHRRKMADLLKEPSEDSSSEDPSAA
jgi:Mg2+ and Co2+ transporter CorA